MRKSLIAVAGLALALCGCGGGGVVPTTIPARTAPEPSKTVAADTGQQANQTPKPEPNPGTVPSVRPSQGGEIDTPPPPPTFWE